MDVIASFFLLIQVSRLERSYESLSTADQSIRKHPHMLSIYDLPAKQSLQPQGHAASCALRPTAASLAHHSAAARPASCASAEGCVSLHACQYFPPWRSSPGSVAAYSTVEAP